MAKATAAHRILFLGKAGDPHCLSALNRCRKAFPQTVSYFANWGDELPQELSDWEGDYIFSYLSRWILSSKILSKAGKAALNFHPGPPEYPGIGCFNFALYDQVDEYGCTCHYMSAEVDAGPIVAVRRFPVVPEDDVASLIAKTYDEQERLFSDIVELLARDEPLPTAQETWTRKPYTRKDLNALSVITPEMSNEEIQRRIRATDFGPWKPTVELGGYVFELRRH